MNIFIIPSWYPSDTNPAWGIFCKEQAEALAESFPNANFCISIWGQNYESTFLLVKDHFKNIKKVLSFHKLKVEQKHLKKNLIEINSPALTWTRKVAQGNINQIIKANEQNFLLFTQQFGKPDVIHAHVGYPAGYIAMHLSKKLSIPYIITEHMTPFPFDAIKKRNGQLIPQLAGSYKMASSVIAVSEALKLSIEKMSFKNVVHIPNMVNESLFKPAKLKRNKEVFNFLFIGELIQRKGVDVLLKAFSKINSSKNIFLTIGGDGDLENKYKEDAKSLSIDHKINWLGFLGREEVAKQMQQCDAFVLVSRKENLPLVLIEAIACGKPIIASRCGGPEIIVNDKNGLLVDVEDVEGLAKAMKQMAEHYSKYDSEVIRKDFKNRFSRPVVASRILKLYKNAIEGSHNSILF